jgi:Putative prokaryotic signal transducing protein
MAALVRVAWARNQAEAELIQGLLLEEGVPSIVQRAAGFDVPDYLAAGPRDILVEADREVAARHILDAVESYDPDDVPAAGEGTPDWVRALAVTLGVLVLVLVAAGIYALI